MKNILITGAACGLGRETAIELSGRGYAVCINYKGSEKEALNLAKSLPNAIALRADVRDISQVKDMQRKLMARWRTLYAIINNAGITKDSLLIKQSEADWDEIMATNLRGCFNMIKVFAPWISASGGGHIINISSRSGLRGKEGQTAYSASKAALFGLTYSVAKELAAENIRVNAILPGYMATKMGSGADKAMKAAQKESLLGRLSSPKEVAGFISWLLSTEGITGQVFSLDSRI